MAVGSIWHPLAPLMLGSVLPNRHGIVRNPIVGKSTNGRLAGGSSRASWPLRTPGARPTKISQLESFLSIIGRQNALANAGERANR
jgi:hypothetical protein